MNVIVLPTGYRPGGQSSRPQHRPFNGPVLVTGTGAEKDTVAGARLCIFSAPSAEEDVLVEVPGPEPDWEPAGLPWPLKRNPALQGSMWDYATGGFRLVAGLSPSLDALAAR